MNKLINLVKKLKLTKFDQMLLKSINIYKMKQVYCENIFHSESNSIDLVL
jgi:hypothetical protein